MDRMRKAQILHITVFLCVLLMFAMCSYFFIKTVVTSNIYFTEEGILRKVQVQNPQFTKVIDVQRSFWDKVSSKVFVEDEENSERQWFCFNTNVMSNHIFVDCP